MNPVCLACGEPVKDLSRDANRSQGISAAGDVRQTPEQQLAAQSRAQRAVGEPQRSSAQLMEDAAAREQQFRLANAVPKLPNMQSIRANVGRAINPRLDNIDVVNLDNIIFWRAPAKAAPA